MNIWPEDRVCRKKLHRAGGGGLRTGIVNSWREGLWRGATRIFASMMLGGVS